MYANTYTVLHVSCDTGLPFCIEPQAWSLAWTTVQTLTLLGPTSLPRYLE